MSGNCGDLAPYALRVTDDSMAPEFPDGCVIIVDPGSVACDGAYVVVDFANDVFFRQFVIEGERRFLKAVNSKYDGMELTGEYKVRGVVVQRAGRRRTEHKHYG